MEPVFSQTRPLFLEMSEVVRAGLLAKPRTWLKLDTGVQVFASFRGTSLFLRVPRVDPAAADSFDYDDARFWNNFKVKIVTRKRHFGNRRYFICPVTGRDCIKLVIDDDLICAKTAYSRERRAVSYSLGALDYYSARRKLLKEDGRSRLSATERARLADRIRRHPERYQTDKEVRRLLSRMRREEQREREKSLWESRPLSTTKAFDCGRGLAFDTIYDWYRRTELDWVESIPAPTRTEVQRGSSIESFPEFDIKVFLSRITLQPEGVLARQLGWPLDATDDCTLSMFIDARFEGLPRLVFAKRKQGEIELTWQKIDFLPGPNSAKPRYFLCPITHARCETLYFRSGYLASREAHRLNAWENGKSVRRGFFARFEIENHTGAWPAQQIQSKQRP